MVKKIYLSSIISGIQKTHVDRVVGTVKGKLKEAKRHMLKVKLGDPFTQCYKGEYKCCELIGFDNEFIFVNIVLYDNRIESEE